MKKLIEEYQSKIDGFDIIIEMVNRDLSKLRKGEELSNHLIAEDVLLDQRNVANVQRQIFVQVIKDIEDYV